MEEQFSNNSINYEALAQAVQKERIENPEAAHKSDKEILSSILARHTQAAAPSAAPAPAASASQSDDLLPSYAKEIPDGVKIQVEHLVTLTFEKGIVAGIARARALNDPFVMDAFHDALSEKLAAALKTRKLL
jgi:hypothetical protein